MGMFNRFRTDRTSHSDQHQAAAAQMDAYAGGPVGGGMSMHLDDSIHAELVPFSAYDFGSGSWGITNQQFDWQQRFREFDRAGPGIVGQSANIPAATSKLITWKIQKQNPATLLWEDDDDPVPMATLRLFRSEHQGMEHLMARIIRLLDGPGEFVGIRRRVGDRHTYSLVSKHNITVDSRNPGMVEVRTRPDARRGSRWWYEVPISQVVHIHNEDEDWPGLPTSPFQRVLPDIETYRMICRSLGRNYKSKLAMNGVLWAEATGDASNWPDKFLDWSRRTVNDKDERDARSVTPFPLVTKQEPKWIRTHAAIEQIDIDTADYFLKAFCRGTDFPLKMLFDGPGSANNWGDYVINDYYADFVMNPRSIKAADVVTHWVLRPWARVMDSWGERDPERYRVWPDMTEVRTRTDNSDRILALGRDGIATRKASAEAAGLRADEIIEIPAGMTEAEWYLTLQGRNNSEPAEPVGTSIKTNGRSVEGTEPDPAGRLDAGFDGDGFDGDGFEGETWSLDEDLVLV